MSLKLISSFKLFDVVYKIVSYSDNNDKAKTFQKQFEETTSTNFLPSL